MMMITEALEQIRQKVNDNDVIELTDDALLMYLNEAVQYIYAFLIRANSTMAVKDMVIEEGATSVPLPENFVKTAGVFPIKITGGVVVPLDEPPMKVRYFYSVGILGADDDMPFLHDALNQQAIKLAAIYAGNQLESDVSQDKALIDEVNAALAQVAGGVMPT